MSNSMDLGSVFQELGGEMRNHWEDTLRYVDHPLELGLARERLLVEYLLRLLPDRFAIDSGFVIDSSGSRSRQIDIVIYDKIIAKPFVVPGQVHFFPCECVVAVGEVKSNITSRATLSDALEKIRSVKALDRFSARKNLEVAVHGLHGHVDVQFMNDEPPINCRILSFVFTSAALELGTMIGELRSHFASTPRSTWPNLVVSFDQYLISYSKQNSRDLQLFPDGANEVYATSPTERDRIIPTFGALVANFLSIAKIVRPLLLTYLGTQHSQILRVPL